MVSHVISHAKHDREMNFMTFYLISCLACLRGRRCFPLSVQLLLLGRLLVPLLVEVPQQDICLLGDYALLPREVLGRYIEGISVSVWDGISLWLFNHFLCSLVLNRHEAESKWKRLTLNVSTSSIQYAKIYGYRWCIPAAHSCGGVVVLSLRRTDVVRGPTGAHFGEVFAVVCREILEKVREGPGGRVRRRGCGGWCHIWWECVGRPSDLFLTSQFTFINAWWLARFPGVRIQKTRIDLMKLEINSVNCTLYIFTEIVCQSSLESNFTYVSKLLKLVFVAFSCAHASQKSLGVRNHRYTWHFRITCENHICFTI